MCVYLTSSKTGITQYVVLDWLTIIHLLTMDLYRQDERGAPQPDTVCNPPWGTRNPYPNTSPGNILRGTEPSVLVKSPCLGRMLFPYKLMPSGWLSTSTSQNCMPIHFVCFCTYLWCKLTIGGACSRDVSIFFREGQHLMSMSTG
jgi:hypothetical protein